MKKVLILILLISTIFLSGCSSLFNLNGWIMPDDLEFLAVIDSLDTPKKICKYMENFEWNISIHTYSPYQMYLANLENWNDTGDCDDFATFATWVAHYHGFEVYRVTMWQKFTGFYGLPLIMPHVLGVFVENGLYTYCNEVFYCPIFTDNFKEIVDDYVSGNCWVSGVINFKVYDYDNNLIKEGK